MSVVLARAPGRVNLLGDHTDHAGGSALPCAIDLGVTISGRRAEHIELSTSIDPQPLHLALPLDTMDHVVDDIPLWGRHVAAVAALLPDPRGIVGAVTADLPVGAGLSSSAALSITTALALGFEGSPMELAHLARAAEHLATGTPTGLLDQLAITHAQSDHAMCIDFTPLTVEQIPFPRGLDIVVVHSGEERSVERSAYAERVAACEAAAELVGPLPSADSTAIAGISDPLLRRRARHVRTECERVDEASTALRADDRARLGEVMIESHRSLRDDFEVSTAALDRAVELLCAMPGVHGARLTGAGFGGCVVAVCDEGAVTDPAALTGRGWILRPADGARID